MQPIIKVENLSKQYRIGRRELDKTLREAVTDALHAPFRRLNSMFRSNGGNGGDYDTIWALKDISFEVMPGEIVGIIGRNGAGKSTLLKILSRITEPTVGKADLYGRVASLLEVGTGFHQELTGRENIYLNGAILGMERGEIERKFDEIVAFAEVEKFLDTPVKRYSSGMYVRLAFAVAAHLEPEILIVDEVLAVGDAQFQKKCLGKIGDVAREGRTVLFVSHNMTAVQTLTNRAVLLDNGAKISDGHTGDVVSKYLEGNVIPAQEQFWEDPLSAPGNDQVRLRLARIAAEDGTPFGQITVRTPLVLEFEYWNFVQDVKHNLTVHLYLSDGAHILSSASCTGVYDVGLVRSKCRIPSNLLNDGSYRVSIMIVRDRSTAVYTHEDALAFEVHDVGREGGWLGKWPGAVRPNLAWQVESLKSTPPSTSTLAL
jgi:lipopolysaccharide transport system ATP-binding protein